MRNSEPTMNRRDLLKVTGMGALGAMLPAPRDRKVDNTNR